MNCVPIPHTYSDTTTAFGAFPLRSILGPTKVLMLREKTEGKRVCCSRPKGTALQPKTWFSVSLPEQMANFSVTHYRLRHGCVNGCLVLLKEIRALMLLFHGLHCLYKYRQRYLHFICCSMRGTNNLITQQHFVLTDLQVQQPLQRSSFVELSGLS